MITKNKILKTIPNKDELFCEIKSLAKQIAKLNKKLNDKTELFNAVNKVSKVVEGEPIEIWGMGPTRDNYESADPKNHRNAKIYRNAHNDKTFGLHIQEYWAKRGGADHRWHGSKWCGAEWKRRKDAEAAAIAWIVHGTLPKFNGTGEVVSEWP